LQNFLGFGMSYIIKACESEGYVDVNGRDFLVGLQTISSLFVSWKRCQASFEASFDGPMLGCGR